MTAEERRTAILKILAQSSQPVSASTLAGRFGVSRQLIVGDVALLRAGGASIIAAARGYLLRREREGLLRQTACRHRVDVIVEHPVYGQLTGALQLSSRYDVQQFIRRSNAAQPLSLLTEGVHLHTLSCPGEDAFARVTEELDRAGFLLKRDE